MTGAFRAWASASLALAGVIVGLAADEPAMAIALASAGLVTVAVKRPVGGNRLIEAASIAASLAAGWGAAAVVVPASATWYGGQLTMIACVLAVAAVVWAAFRLVLARPFGGYPVTALAACLAVLFASTARIGALFSLLGSLYVVVQLVALSRAEPELARWAGRSWRHRRLAVVGLGVAAATTVAAALALPVAYHWSLRRFGLEHVGSSSGFSTTLRLDDLEDMFESDELVLRIYGPRPDYLRGAVFTTYARGRWASGSTSAPRWVSLRPLSGSRRPDQVEILAVGGDRRRRYFTPLDMRGASLTDRVARAEATGVLLAAAGEDAGRIRFELAPRDELEPAGPGPDDLAIPEHLAAPLADVARRWTAGVPGPEGKALALVRHLRTEFRYSLDFRTRRRVDPLLDFFERRSGHCEYFATALALLARALGIPTRVVAGYRVAELNPIGGYHVVRERDAHAWVEAHVPGRGWVTLDATPASGPADRSEARTPWASAIADELVSSATRAVIWITDRSPRELLAVAVLALVPWVLVRWLRRRARRGRAPRRASATSYRAPRASVSQLLVALDRRGEPRADSEPLERLASRISRSAKLPPGAGESAADLLFRYAAWRYGDEGEPGAIDAAIASWISRFEAER